MTKRVTPLPAQADGVPTPTREKVVKIQEFFRKSGVPLEAVAGFVVKGTCVEALLKNGARRVYNYGL
jgi:hypothetical protein